MKNSEKCIAAMKAVLESSLSADEMIEVLEFLMDRKNHEVWCEKQEEEKA
jgi:hypothetical protein